MVELGKSFINSNKNIGPNMETLGSVAYLGLPAPGGKVIYGAPIQNFRGSLDAKSELGLKRRQKLNRTLHIVVYRPAWKLHMTVTSRIWRQDLWILETINCRRVKNLIVSREAILTLNFRSQLNTQTVVLQHSQLQ